MNNEMIKKITEYFTENKKTLTGREAKEIISAAMNDLKIADPKIISTVLKDFVKKGTIKVLNNTSSASLAEQKQTAIPIFIESIATSLDKMANTAGALEDIKSIAASLEKIAEVLENFTKTESEKK